jgi:hypothetical protein
MLYLRVYTYLRAHSVISSGSATARLLGLGLEVGSGSVSGLRSGLVLGLVLGLG